jgi:hypothetical protein
MMRPVSRRAASAFDGRAKGSLSRGFDLTAVDRSIGEVKKTVHLPYPNFSGTPATGGRAISAMLQ